MSASENILIVGVNWIGDTIMSMPAIQAFRRIHPAACITMLVKPSMRDVWSLHAAPDRCWVWRGDRAAMAESLARLRAEPFGKAYILPNSFRSAWLPWRANIPERIGMKGHWRRALLTQRRVHQCTPQRKHQVFEYYDILTPDPLVREWEPPQLCVPDTLKGWAVRALGALPRPRVALLPGAARGPAKQWPPHHFIELGRRLAEDAGASLVILGAPGEAPSCREIARAIGPATLSLAGETNLSQWLGLLGEVDLVVANDSGGMHAAAALNTPVVAVYGRTDPSVTGPLSENSRVIKSANYANRSIARNSRAAIAAMAAVLPDEVYDAAMDLLKNSCFFCWHEPDYM